MKTIIFNTGNEGKWEVARDVFRERGLELTRQKLETPEIQATRVDEVAKYSARWAADQLGQPVLVTDVGYYFSGLKGFPGPYIKYINQWLSADDLVRLTRGLPDRSVVIEEVVAYCEPGAGPHTFVSQSTGQLVEAPEGEGSAIDQLLLRDGFDRVQSHYSSEEMLTYWKNNLSHYHEAAEFIALQRS